MTIRQGGSIIAGMVGEGLPEQAGQTNNVLMTDGSNASWITTETVYPVTETYSSGTNWYRVYSDGWVEQGGELSSVTQNSTNTINLLKPFANTNYSVIITATGGSRSNAQYMNCESVNTRNTNNFIIRTNDYTFGRIWRAAGYGATN